MRSSTGRTWNWGKEAPSPVLPVPCPPRPHPARHPCPRPHPHLAWDRWAPEAMAVCLFSSHRKIMDRFEEVVYQAMGECLGRRGHVPPRGAAYAPPWPCPAPCLGPHPPEAPFPNTQVPSTWAQPWKH